jgi:hypothetical protein
VLPHVFSLQGEKDAQGAQHRQGLGTDEVGTHQQPWLPLLPYLLDLQVQWTQKVTAQGYRCALYGSQALTDFYFYPSY